MKQLVRTEQAYSGGAWNNDNKLTYKYNALQWQTYEERHDWSGGAWSNRYDTTQSYDKVGNRTGYDHNIAVGTATSYCRAMNLSYTFNAMNQLTAISDADESQYGATVTCDANGNITQVTGSAALRGGELIAGTEARATNHQYDATGRLAKSTYTQYYQGDMPSVSSLEHIYAGANHLQNFDGSNYGEVWHWAGAANSHGSPLRSPNPDTASQKGYNIAAMGGKNTPQRRTWTSPTVEGNKRELFGQGRPMAKDSSGNGANWWVGTKSDPPISGTAVESRYFFEGTVSATDMSRASDSREAQRIGIFGTSNSYGGSYGRVTNEALGRDLNPLGRGGGQALVGGWLNVGQVYPSVPGHVVEDSEQGNSVNNGCLERKCSLDTLEQKPSKPTPKPTPAQPPKGKQIEKDCGQTEIGGYGNCCVQCCIEKFDSLATGVTSEADCSFTVLYDSDKKATCEFHCEMTINAPQSRWVIIKGADPKDPCKGISSTVCKDMSQSTGVGHHNPGDAWGSDIHGLIRNPIINCVLKGRTTGGQGSEGPKDVLPDEAQKKCYDAKSACFNTAGGEKPEWCRKCNKALADDAGKKAITCVDRGYPEHYKNPKQGGTQGGGGPTM